MVPRNVRVHGSRMPSAEEVLTHNAASCAPSVEETARNLVAAINAMPVSDPGEEGEDEDGTYADHDDWLDGDSVVGVRLAAARRMAGEQWRRALDLQEALLEAARQLCGRKP